MPASHAIALKAEGMNTKKKARRMSEPPSTTTSQESIAIHLQFVLQYAFWCHTALRKGKYFNTPPICIAARLPSVSQYASHLYHNTKHQRFPEGSWRSFRRNWWRTSGEVWKEFSSFFCWGKSSEAFSTKTPPQISPSNFTTRFWVVANTLGKI